MSRIWRTCKERFKSSVAVGERTICHVSQRNGAWYCEHNPTSWGCISKKWGAILWTQSHWLLMYLRELGRDTVNTIPLAEDVSQRMGRDTVNTVPLAEDVSQRNGAWYCEHSPTGWGCISEKWGVILWAQSHWLRLVSDYGSLWARQWTGFHRCSEYLARWNTYDLLKEHH
jgi:hypothetical protein